MLTKQTQYRGTVKSSKTGDHHKNKIIKRKHSEVTKIHQPSQKDTL